MDTLNIELEQHFAREVKRMEDSLNKDSSAFDRFFGITKLSKGEKSLARRFFWYGVLSYLEIKYPDITKKIREQEKRAK